MKTKDFALEVKAVNDEGMFEGYCSVFGVRDVFNEVVEPGAFMGSISKRAASSWPLLLWQHQSAEPIGTWEDLAEDKKGLWGRGRLLLDIQKGKEAHIRLKAGAVRGLSIGYRELEVEEPTERADPRRLLKLDLLEASIVSFPANPRAHVDSVKAAELAPLLQKLSAGDRLSEREWEVILKAEPFGLSNSQAERAVRVNLKRGQGDPDVTAELVAKQAHSALREALAAFKSP